MLYPLVSESTKRIYPRFAAKLQAKRLIGNTSNRKPYPDGYVTVKHASGIIKFHPTTINGWCREGEVPSVIVDVKHKSGATRTRFLSLDHVIKYVKENYPDRC